MSEALCVTALGPAALCDAVLDAVGRLFAAEWATLVLTSGDLQSSVPSPVTWHREPGQRGRAPAVAEVAALAARITDSAQVMTAGDGAARATVLGAPMRLDHRQVGTLLISTEHPADPDGIGLPVLETVANQIVAALRNAWLFSRGEDLRRQAQAGRAEAERHAEELASRNEQLRRARGQLARARQAELVSAERHRIARELHDGVAQCLVGIGMHLEWCHRHLDPALPAYSRLVASKELARAGLGRVRSAVAELSELERPGLGLGEALRDLAANFRSAGPLRVSVRVSGSQRQLAARGGARAVPDRPGGPVERGPPRRRGPGLAEPAVPAPGRPACPSPTTAAATRPPRAVISRARWRPAAGTACASWPNGPANSAARSPSQRRRGGGLRMQACIPVPPTLGEPA